jgi:hypothetical protein
MAISARSRPWRPGSARRQRGRTQPWAVPAQQQAQGAVGEGDHGEGGQDRQPSRHARARAACSLGRTCSRSRGSEAPPLSCIVQARRVLAAAVRAGGLGWWVSRRKRACRSAWPRSRWARERRTHSRSALATRRSSTPTGSARHGPRRELYPLARSGALLGGQGPDAILDRLLDDLARHVGPALLNDAAVLLIRTEPGEPRDRTCRVGGTATTADPT